jgi:hypothetical protein
MAYQHHKQTATRYAVLAVLCATLATTAASTGICSAWRQTGGCAHDGVREPANDNTCDHEIVEGSSGYCECNDAVGTGTTKTNLRNCDGSADGKALFPTCNAACGVEGWSRDTSGDAPVKITEGFCTDLDNGRYIRSIDDCRRVLDKAWESTEPVTQVDDATLPDGCTLPTDHDMAALSGVIFNAKQAPNPVPCSTTAPCICVYAGGCNPGFAMSAMEWDDMGNGNRGNVRSLCTTTTAQAGGGRLVSGTGGVQDSSATSCDDGACAACSAGKHQTALSFGGSTCNSCDVGKYAPDTTKECKPCEGQTWSKELYAPATAHSHCSTCAAGKYETKEGDAGSCVDCGAGFASGILGAFECTKCASGTYTSATGSKAECIECAGKTISAQVDPDCVTKFKGGVRCELVNVGCTASSSVSITAATSAATLVVGLFVAALG